MKSILTATGVAFELADGRALFTDISFSLGPRITALVGPNGVGKSCLARLLAGDLEPSKGRIHRRASVGYLPQRRVPPPQTVAEFLAADYAWSEAGDRLLDGLDRQALCTHLSGGQWMRVRLASALRDQYLILDEPTNDLDREGRDGLLRFLRDHDEGVLLISHDREALSLCDEVLELSNQGLSKFGGDWGAYEQARAVERESLSAALDGAKRNRDEAREERQARLARQEKRNRRGAKAGARGDLPKILSGARRRRAQATSGSVDSETLAWADDAVREAHAAFAGLKIDPVMYADLTGEEVPARKLVAEAHGFNIRFRDWLYPQDLDFTWRGGVRLAIKGANGSGKSSLLRAVTSAAADRETRGELRTGGLRTLYLDQRCAMLEDGESVIDNVRAVSSADDSGIRNGLAKFLFAKDAVFQKAGTLSGGERLRAALARGLLGTEKPQLLILDEPTNNLDLVNIRFLENLVSGFRGAVLIVSHDLVFLENCGISAELVLPLSRR
jgi:ATPase subunit of ABC transporter with duplicated ATPase domains